MCTRSCLPSPALQKYALSSRCANRLFESPLKKNKLFLFIRGKTREISVKPIYLSPLNCTFLSPHPETVTLVPSGVATPWSGKGTGAVWSSQVNGGSTWDQQWTNKMCCYHIKLLYSFKYFETKIRFKFHPKFNILLSDFTL